MTFGNIYEPPWQNEATNYLQNRQKVRRKAACVTFSFGICKQDIYMSVYQCVCIYFLR